MIFLFYIYSVFYGIAQSFFLFQNVMGFFAASENEGIEFHPIRLCHDQTQLL